MDSIEHDLIELRQAGIVSRHARVAGRLQGTTDSRIFVIADEDRIYVYKAEAGDLIGRASGFLRLYEDLPLFPPLIYTSPDNRYYLYGHIEGAIQTARAPTRCDMTFVVRTVLNAYRPSRSKGWGDPFFGLTDTLHQSVLDVVNDEKTINDSILGEEEQRRIVHVAGKLFGEREFVPYVCHGDLGAHNMIYRDGKLVGIIDPEGINSIPVLDLMYLICSKPHHDDFSTVLALFDELDECSGFTRDDVKDIYRVTLYNRIAASTRYHPGDTAAYVEAYTSL